MCASGRGLIVCGIGRNVERLRIDRGSRRVFRCSNILSSILMSIQLLYVIPI